MLWMEYNYYAWFVNFFKICSINYFAVLFYWATQLIIIDKTEFLLHILGKPLKSVTFTILSTQDTFFPIFTSP